MKANLLNKLIAVAAIAVSGGLYAADAPAAPGKPADKSPAKIEAPSAGDVKKEMEKFNAQRDTMLAERQALISQLKTASEAQRKAILEKMKELAAMQSELSKQMRDDLRKQRQR